MSDSGRESDAVQPIRVEINDGDRIKELEKKLKEKDEKIAERDEVLQSIVDKETDETKAKLIQEHPELEDKILNITDLATLETVRSVLEDSTENKRASTGTVRLLEPSEKKDDIYKRQFDTKQAMFNEVVQQSKTDPKLNDDVNELMEKTWEKPSGKSVIMDEEPKETQYSYIAFPDYRPDYAFKIPISDQRRYDPKTLLERCKRGFYK